MRAATVATLLITAVLLVVLGVRPEPVVAQDHAVEAYYGAVADHFGLPSSEVRVLDWDI